MKTPLTIKFHNLDRSPAIEAAVQERVDRLEHFGSNVTSCRVTIDAPHKHSHKGEIYSVLIDLRMPGSELVASRSPSKHHAHDDVYVAIRDAFDALQRQLQDRVRIRRGKVKSHEPMPSGIVARMFPEEDYGLIRDASDREIYFHRNSVIDSDFNGLESGMEVRFVEEQGEEGPQASTVRVVTKRPKKPSK